MLVFILPTKGPQGYRGKYPNRARSVSVSSMSGTYVELNSGARLWTMSAGLPTTVKGFDYAAELAHATPMTDSQYAELSDTAELARSILGIAGNTRRDAIRAQVRARREAIGRPAAPTPQAEPAARRITWTLWIVFSDDSRSLADILDWEPGYNGTARQAWRYAWGAFRAAMRDPAALGGVRFLVDVEGR